MKKIHLIILIVFIIIIIIGVILMLKKTKKPIEISNIKYMHFGYSTGTMVNSYVYYDIDYENNAYYATIKPNNIADEDKLKIEISTEIVDKIESIFKKYEVQKWDGFNKSDQNVLDGNSFSLSIGFMNKERISASGYMMYPKNYREVANELDEIFMNIYNSK